MLPVRPRKLKTNKQKDCFSLKPEAGMLPESAIPGIPLGTPPQGHMLGIYRYILHTHAVTTSEGVTENCHLSVTWRDVENSCPKIPTTSPAWESPLPITWHRPPILQSTARSFSLTKFGLSFLMPFGTFRWSQGTTAISQGFPFSILPTCKI